MWGAGQGVRGRKTVTKALVAIAMEVKQDGRGLGRTRMRVVADASARNLLAFVRWAVAPGSTVHTDGWPSYGRLGELGYRHEADTQKAPQLAGDLLPHVHRVAALFQQLVARDTPRRHPSPSSGPLSGGTQHPLQSPQFVQSRHAVLPACAACSGDRAGAVQRDRRWKPERPATAAAHWRPTTRYGRCLNQVHTPVMPFWFVMLAGARLVALLPWLATALPNAMTAERPLRNGPGEPPLRCATNQAPDTPSTITTSRVKDLLVSLRASRYSGSSRKPVRQLCRGSAG